MNGKIFDNEENVPLSSAKILNKRTGNFSLSDDNGLYRIHCKYGDTIEVSLMGYFAIQFVNYEATKEEFYRNVYLKVDAFQLSEVEVKSYTPYQKDSIARRQLYDQPLARPWVSGVGVVFSPATAIGQMVSKKAKTRRRFQLNYWKWENERLIESRYSKEFVSKLVPLRNDSLAYFMNAYPIAADFARAATEMELKMWILYNYREWIIKPKIPIIDTIPPIK